MANKKATTNGKAKVAKAKAKKAETETAKPNAVVKQKAGAVIKHAAPDFINEELPELNIEPGELSIPLVKLLQATSGEANCESPLGKAGEFFDSASQESLGDEIYFVAILLNRKRIMWTDFDSGGGIDCIAYDNKSGSTYGPCSDCIDETTGIHRCEFGPNDEKPLCTKYYDFISVVLPDAPEVDEETKVILPIDGFSVDALSVISFGTTKIKAARRLIMIAQAKKAALYANVFKMTRKFVEQKGNKFYVPEVEWIGWVNMEMYNSIKSNLKALKAMAGNPENYTQESPEAEENQANKDVKDGEYYEASKEDDLPF